MAKNSTTDQKKKKEDPFSFEVNLLNRYYHFVVISTAKGFTVSDIWNIIPYKLSNKTMHIVSKNFLGIDIHQRQIESIVPFRQQDEDDIDMKPPYFTDIFISQVNNHLLLFFPFRAIAKKCIEELINHGGGLEFWKLGMNDFVQSNFENTSKEIVSDLGTNILGVDVGINEDKVNSVSIAGEHPLDSKFYTQFLKTPIETGTYTINSIRIKGSTIAASVSYPKSRAKVHLDFYGNGKFFLHIGGRNILVLALLWKSLIKSKCLSATDENPIPRIKKD